MSIYPVHAKSWFDREEYSMLKEVIIAGQIKCHECGEVIKDPAKFWVMHSFPYGGPDEAWCNKECLEAK